MKPKQGLAKAKQAPPPAVQGEGDYTADRRYRARTGQLLAKADVSRAARDAEPKSAQVANELLAAEKTGRSHIAGASKSDPETAAEPTDPGQRAPNTVSPTPSSR